MSRSESDVAGGREESPVPGAGPGARRHVLLAGRPGVGKTTVLRRTAERLAREGVRAAGFYTEEIRDDGDRRTGFRGVPLAGGSEAVIADVELEGGPRVSRYGVDVDAVDRLAERTLDPADDAAVVLVDEVGKMECLSDVFVERMRALLEGPRPVLATVGAGGEGFREEIRRRPDVELWRVTRENRDGLPDRLADHLREAVDGGGA